MFFFLIFNFKFLVLYLVASYDLQYNLALHYVGVDFDVALLLYSSLVAFVLFI